MQNTANKQTGLKDHVSLGKSLALFITDELNGKCRQKLSASGSRQTGKFKALSSQPLFSAAVNWIKNKAEKLISLQPEPKQA